MHRRTFIKAGAALAGSLVIDFAIPLGESPALAQAAPPPFAPNAFIRIDREGTVTLVMPLPPAPLSVAVPASVTFARFTV